MTEENVQTAEQEEKERVSLVEALHRVLLASIGAVALAQEEIEDFVSKLVERGEIAEKEGRSMIRDVVEKRKKEAQKAQEGMDEQVEKVMGRMNVPSKSDIDSLSAKITALTKKVDELKKQS